MYDVNLLHFYSLAIDWKLHVADKNIFCLPVSKQFDNPPSGELSEKLNPI